MLPSMPGSEMCLRRALKIKINIHMLETSAEETLTILAAAERHAVCRKGTFY